MSDDDYPSYDEFAHRQAHPIKDLPVVRKRALQILEDLLGLEARTHPQNPSPNSKELDSISALAAAGKLVELLAGWAIDHRAGMILNGATVFRWPEDDQEARSEANDHRHEAVGSAYLQDKAPGGPIQNRHILTEVTARVALLPAALRNELSEALHAVDFGETRGLFSPPKGQHKNAYTKWRLRLRAVEHAYFLSGKGETQETAFEQVAEAYGVTADAVDSWNRGISGLLHHFGPAVVKVAQDTARKSGERFCQLQMLLHKSDLDNDAIKFLHRVYGPEALSLNAQRFKGANRDDPE